MSKELSDKFDQKVQLFQQPTFEEASAKYKESAAEWLRKEREIQRLESSLSLHREALECAVGALEIISQKQGEFEPPGTARDGWEIASQFARNAKAAVVEIIGGTEG